MIVGSYSLESRRIDGVEIYAPAEFWLLTDEDRRSFGCGAGKFGDRIVPDRMWGLSVWICCAVHDFMYSAGRDCHDKWAADVTFLTNMNDVIEAKSNALVKPLRRWRAMTYFSAVRDFGNTAFWKGKS